MGNPAGRGAGEGDTGFHRSCRQESTCAAKLAIELFYLFTQRDEAKFNDSPVRALDLYQRFWTADEERRTISLLAIVALAKDAGMTIDVKSEYLPKKLLDGAWVGEFLT
jgi:immunity protein 49 of polymorphic toxin system